MTPHLPETPRLAGPDSVGVPALAATPVLSIVVPAFNEAERLPRTLQLIRSYADSSGEAIEVIVVDDGSDDETSARAVEFGGDDARFRVIRLPRNRGKGAAVQAGVAASVGEFVLFSDADGSIPIEEVDRLRRHLDDGTDVVIASRHLPSDDATVRFKPTRRAPGWLFHQFVRTVALSGLTDTQCGFKYFRAAVARELFADLTTDGFAFDVELLMLARRRGYRVREVAVNCQHVPGSKVRLLQDGLGMCLEVLRIRRRFARGDDDRSDAAGAGRAGGSALAAAGVSGGRWIWPGLTFAVFLVANHLLVRGRAVGLWDADSQFFPYFALVADYARAGRFLGWDPWTNGGLPTYAEPQVGAFSPINNAFALLTGGTSVGFVTYWMAIWWLGAVGIFLLGRHLRAPAWGACAVSLGYLFCGVYTANAQHTSWLVAFSFLPLIVWRLDVALVERRPFAAVQAGALWGLAALSAHPSLVILTGCFCALWTAGRWLGEPFASTGDDRHATSPADGAWPRRASAIFGVLALVLLTSTGTAILAPTYHSFIAEGAGVTARTGALERRVALSNELDPSALVTLTSAYTHRLAAQNRGSIFARSDISMATIYTGVLIPALALLALLGRGAGAWRWWLASVAALSLACAMGESLPLRGWLYDAFYPMRVFRHSAVFRLFFLFTLAVLALLATRDLARALRAGVDDTWKRFFLVASGTAIVAMLVYGIFLAQVRWTGHSSVAFLMPVTWVALVGLAAASWRLRPARRRLAVPVLFAALAAGDAVLAATLSRLTTLHEGEAVERWRGLDAARSARLDLAAVGLHRDESPCVPAPPERCRSNDQLITKRPTFNANPSQWHEAHRTMLGLPVLARMALGSDRIWFAADAVEAPPVRAAFDGLVRRAEALGTPPLLLHSRADLLRYAFDDAPAGGAADLAVRLADAGPMAPVPVRLLEYRAESLAFEVEAPGAGWLLVTDRWAPSWRARVNGEPAAVFGGNFLSRAVRVPEGSSRVEFVYQPRFVGWLLALSWSTLVAVLFFTITGALRARRTPV